VLQPLLEQKLQKLTDGDLLGADPQARSAPTGVSRPTSADLDGMRCRLNGPSCWGQKLECLRYLNETSWSHRLYNRALSQRGGSKTPFRAQLSVRQIAIL